MPFFTNNATMTHYFTIDDDIESQVKNVNYNDEQYNSTFNVFNLIIKIIQ
jgi:hypothetical protein